MMRNSDEKESYISKTAVIRVSEAFRELVNRLRGRQSTADFLDSIGIVFDEDDTSKVPQTTANRLDRIESTLKEVDEQTMIIASRVIKEYADPVNQTWQAALNELFLAIASGDKSAISSMALEIEQRGQQIADQRGHYNYSPDDLPLQMSIHQRILSLSCAELALEYEVKMRKAQVHKIQSKTAIL